MTKTRKMRPIRKTAKKYHIYCCDATFHGLHGWHKALYEELGWMVLAKHRGLTDKTATYKHSIERLKNTLEDKLKQTKDHDRKEDLKILHENVLVLHEHAMKDL
uniref:Transposase n=1 Tax=viral metagenome TaxID=1070528 RepID=A0A6C0HB26_9ZZZZ